jgi:hypothetical protein
MLFPQFPKTRPALPPEYLQVYEEQYKRNRQGKSAASAIAQRMEAWMHSRVAAGVRPGATTLEVGAGTLNHLPYEPSSDPYDIVEPAEFLYRGSPLLARVRNIYRDVRDIPPVVRYARIISIATFEHVCDLPEVVARCGLLLQPEGHLQVAIPSEGTPLWNLGWRFTTGLEFRLRHRLDYGVLVRHEHVNTAREIEQVLRGFFSSVRRRVLGVSRWLSLYQYYDCSSPKGS